MTGTGLRAMRLHSREEFRTWLAQDLEIRDELETIVGDPLGVDEASLDTLEAFLLNRFPDIESALVLDQRPVLDAASRHVGLVTILMLDDAKWDIVLNDEDNIYYRLPIVRLASGGEFCPLATVTTALDRRTGNYLRMVVEDHAED